MTDLSAQSRNSFNTPVALWNCITCDICTDLVQPTANKDLSCCCQVFSQQRYFLNCSICHHQFIWGGMIKLNVGAANLWHVAPPGSKIKKRHSRLGPGDCVTDLSQLFVCLLVPAVGSAIEIRGDVWTDDYSVSCLQGVRGTLRGRGHDHIWISDIPLWLKYVHFRWNSTKH